MLWLSLNTEVELGNHFFISSSEIVFHFNPQSQRHIEELPATSRVTSWHPWHPLDPRQTSGYSSRSIFQLCVLSFTFGFLKFYQFTSILLEKLQIMKISICFRGHGSGLVPLFWKPMRSQAKQPLPTVARQSHATLVLRPLCLPPCKNLERASISFQHHCVLITNWRMHFVLSRISFTVRKLSRIQL